MSSTPDAFAAYHASLIQARYDCVERLVVNCYFQLGQTGGGFRTFWRRDPSAQNAHAQNTNMLVLLFG